jgi:poly(3-hydroxybutyrate) depolymerase
VRTPWCGDRVTALDASTCYVLPDAPPRELLIYLHGIIPPEQASPQKANLEAVVANAARRAGVAAIIPRGEQGLAPRGRDRWWGWPTGDASYRRRGPALVALLGDARARFEAFVGITFARVYVAGSSSGAYFVSQLALRGSLRADGFAAISGGAGRDAGSLASLTPAPIYIGYSTHDASAGSARSLGALLRGAGWPVRVEAHEVPHGAHEVYLDEAFAFWREHAPPR